MKSIREHIKVVEQASPLVEYDDIKVKKDVEQWALANKINFDQAASDYEQFLHSVRTGDELSPTDRKAYDPPELNSAEEHSATMAKMDSHILHNHSDLAQDHTSHHNLKELAKNLILNASSAVDYLLEKEQPMYWRADTLKQYNNPRTYDSNVRSFLSNQDANLYLLFLSDDAEKHKYADRRKSFIGYEQESAAKAEVRGANVLAVFPWEKSIISWTKSKQLWNTKISSKLAKILGPYLNKMSGGTGVASISAFNNLLYATGELGEQTMVKFDNLADFHDHFIKYARLVYVNAHFAFDGNLIHVSQIVNNLPVNYLKNPNSFSAYLEELIKQSIVSRENYGKTINHIVDNELRVRIVSSILNNWQKGKPSTFRNVDDVDVYEFEGSTYHIGKVKWHDYWDFFSDNSLTLQAREQMDEFAIKAWDEMVYLLTNANFGIKKNLPRDFVHTPLRKGEIWTQGRQTFVPKTLLVELVEELKSLREATIQTESAKKRIKQRRRLETNIVIPRDQNGDFEDEVVHKGDDLTADRLKQLAGLPK